MAIRKILLGVLLLLFVVAICHRLNQFEAVVATLSRGKPGWVALALLLQIGTLLNQPALYQSLYYMLGLPVRWRELAPTVWAGHFVNVVTPAAGLGGTALLFEQGRQRGFQAALVTLANTLYFLLNFIWFALLLGASLVLLWLWHDLKLYELVASSILGVGVVLALGALWMVGARPQLFARWLERLKNWINRLGVRWLHRRLLPEEAMRDFVTQFGGAIAALKASGSRLGRPWLHAMLVDGLEIAVLGACFGAFPATSGAIEVTPAIVLVGYCIGTLFLVVSITPQGLGVVEGVMTAIFVSLGVPLERAAAVVLVYRGLSFWLPLLAGFLALRWTPALLARTSAKGLT